ncbi:MAG: ABC transporter ATP-binding protein [Pirellulales bacterium]
MNTLQSDLPKNDTTVLSNAPLRLSGVVKKFRQGESVVEALRDASLTINDGEFVAVMGASGSGKSTLLHVMAGLTETDAGTIEIEGTSLAGLSDKKLTLFRRRRIGLVFQAFNLIPSLTAEENVALPLLADGRDPYAGGKLDKLFERLGISGRRKHRPDAMSGGEQQRTAIARALIGDPAIVLADEPTGSLDSVSGENLCRLLRELNREENRTIVVVTHEPSVAIWADRVVVMKDGRIIADFATADFADSHALAAHYQEIVGVAAKVVAR